MDATRGLIVFAHGSRDVRWREPVEAVARRAAELDPSLLVRCAYLEMVDPSLAGAASELIAAGARSIDVLPMFFGIGKHLREDLPQLLNRLRDDQPDVVFTLRKAVGEDPEVIDLLAQIAVKNFTISHNR